MKTLYVSDLDGTLLRSEIYTSEFTNRTINSLAAKGALFSYATARSFVTARKVTKGLEARIPLIVYNGAFIVDNSTGEIMVANHFGSDVSSVLEDLIRCGVWPLVYSVIDGKEKFSYVRENCSRGMVEFIDTRSGDPRDNPVPDKRALFAGKLFYITCIDEERKLRPLYEKYREAYHCVFQRDIYSGEQWLEIMPKETSKAHAIAQLKERLGCDRLVVFGDGINDIDMFQMADESYAVENAAEELKMYATGIIGKNDDDAVAKWLLENI